ncbi:dehydratase [Lysinibacillus sphaericus]|uniref:(R)-specific enoyl-CoA hydratase n=1 Tax=Lysinibacillus sphaericus TaxID=1421 RepID=A0A2S5D0B7_LYSSH|nr:MaoC/PaaZ C-terminal domain-containing protein [Lysinibacillus sphaericus]OEC01411.1 dehydratase [Lysinibacillus sphaericus]POZ56513.1 (R)-specific enoyl-CoA hydratase [Lysinibacillus sphaericus]
MLQFKELQQGQKLEPLVKPAVTKVQLVKYAGASGDFNPLHTDDAFAQSIGMPGVIAHGMLVMGFLGQYVMELAGTSATLTNFNMRFGAMTRPGDEITCLASVKKIYQEQAKQFVDLDLYAEKAPGKIVGFGEATLQLIEL